MKTAEVFYTERNGNKHPEKSLKDGELISPIWCCQLMKEYAYELFKEKENEIEEYAQERTKDIFLFTEWTGKEGIYWRGNRWHYLDKDWTSDELYQYWLKEVKK